MMPSRPESPRILIVDPDGRSRLRLSRLLEEDGFWVEESDDFSDVADRLDAGIGYDIVITEAGRHGEGASLAREVSVAHPAVATILIESRAAGGPIDVRAVPTGAFDLLDPGFSSAELGLVVERACTRRDLLFRDRQADHRLRREILRREDELLGRHSRRSELWRLAAASTPHPGGDTVLDSFCRFAREAFELDTVALILPGPDRLHFAAFCDGRGRSPRNGFLESDSDRDSAEVFSIDLSFVRGLAWNRSAQTNPPPDWVLVDGNRGAAFWPVSGGRGRAFMYTATDSRDVAIRDRDAALFAVLRSRVESRFREREPGGLDTPRSDFLVAARRFVRGLEPTVQVGADASGSPFDRRMGTHAVRVEQFATILGQNSGWLDDGGIFRLAAAALLHDIGKVSAPSPRPGSSPRTAPPSPFERMLERAHPVIAGRMVRGLHGVDLEPAVRHHHEHFDGTGFPDGLTRNSIPVEAQLILAADTFDHLTAPRWDNAGLSVAVAVEELAKESGRRLAPAIVELVSSCADELRRAGGSQPSVDLAEAS